MSAAPTLPEQLLIASMPRKRFTRCEVERLIETGFFAGQRCELIDGELIDKMGQNPPHAFSISLFLDWLAAIFGTSRVRVQLSMEASGPDRDRSIPEPDLAVLYERKPDYLRRHPRGDELLLLVEIADTGAAFDLSRKVALYSQASVREYWVLDLNRRALIVHRLPDGIQYRDIHVYTENDLVSIEGRTEQLLVRDVLPTT
jgi:Uma2 family endonuclease